MKQRLRGLLALMLCLGVMMTTGISASAKITYNDANGDEVQVGQRISGGTTLYPTATGGDAIEYIEYNGVSTKVATTGSSFTINTPTSVSGYENNVWIVTAYTPGSPDKLTLKRIPLPGASNGSGGGGHDHTYQWKITLQPTETEDGLAEYICDCGSVEARQPVSYFHVIIKKILKAVEEAPENGTVVIDNELLRCFSDEIVAAILNRPDVTVVVTYTDNQDIVHNITIPAGGAPTDGAEWYGYDHLHNVYGCSTCGNPPASN